ncbi:hypothetical protein [Nostoc sp. CHAB 5715]|uniref:hypothetical protein n=1 Tax=Nostoc sp. CHAB 5715 TaxID=2780400 RepID=UPI001E509F8E|nr:hypothetical protein [Nostoc sp. CHAB 5715]MCC5620710.1 hypothetical protein [Nostoc sp. CHAB 5715]
MPLPIELDKALSFGRKASISLLEIFNPGFGFLARTADTASDIEQRLTVSQKQSTFGKAVTFIKNFTLGSLAAAVGGAVIVGAGVALAGLASLGTVGALSASFIGAGMAAFSLTQLVSIVASTSNFVLNFDINQTDEQLDQLLAQKIEGFYGLLGNVVGESMGYLVCGAIPGAISFAFNPAVGAAIMRDLDDDARSEILGQVNVIARTAFQTMINAELANRFKSSRRFLKKNPDNGFAKMVKSIIGEENFKKWGDSNNSSFTIHQDIIEKRIEAIPDKGKRQFLEEALEGFADSCLESGYIVASNLDSQLAAQALMRQSVLGRSTDVSISFT